MLRFHLIFAFFLPSFCAVMAQDTASTFVPTNLERSITNHKLYPNPTTGDFQMKFDWQGADWQEATLLVFDANGDLILQEKNLLTSGQNIWDESLKTRKSGTYQIEIILDNKLIVSEPLILSRN